MRSKFKDLEAERQLLEEYGRWVGHVCYETDKGATYRTWNHILRNMFQVVEDERKTVNEEHEMFLKLALATSLARWERLYLDNDGSTKITEEKVKKGWNVFRDPKTDTVLWNEAIETKYGYLLKGLPRKPTNDLETWKFNYLDDDGGTIKAQERLRNNQVQFGKHLYGGEEARSEYESLFEWEVYICDKMSGITGLQHDLSQGQNIFYDKYNNHRGAQKASAKYAYLLQELPRPPSDDLETWEHFHLDADGGTTRIRAGLEKNVSLFTGDYFGGEHAIEKYGHLGDGGRMLDLWALCED